MTSPLNTLRAVRTAALALAWAATCLAAPAAQAATVGFDGQILYQKDQVELRFSLASASTVSLWTDSWLQGLNFDPMLTVFNAAGQWLASNDDDDNASNERAYDAGLVLDALAAGQYIVRLTVAPNAALGNTLAAGFAFDADAPVLLSDWTQPSADINRGDQKGGAWQISLSGVDSAQHVPEPGSAALVLAALLAAGAMSRRTRR